MRTIYQAHELVVLLGVVHVNMPGNKLAGRVELEQDSVNDHGMNEIYGVLTGQSVHDAVAKFQEIRGFLNVRQSTEEFVLAIGHTAAQAFENGLGVAFTPELCTALVFRAPVSLS